MRLPRFLRFKMLLQKEWSEMWTSMQTAEHVMGLTTQIRKLMNWKMKMMLFNQGYAVDPGYAVDLGYTVDPGMQLI